MTQDEAKSFLLAHTPLPEDKDFEDGVIEQFAEAFEAVKASGDVELLKILLHSLGPGSGFGVFQVLDDLAFVGFTRAQVADALESAMNSPLPHIRGWACELSPSPGHKRLRPTLERLMYDDPEPEGRFFAATDTVDYRDQRMLELFRELVEIEPDSDNREALQRSLDYFEKNGLEFPQILKNHHPDWPDDIS